MRDDILIPEKMLKSRVEKKFSNTTVSNENGTHRHGKIVKIMYKTNSQYVIFKFQHGNEFLSVQQINSMFKTYSFEELKNKKTDELINILGYYDVNPKTNNPMKLIHLITREQDKFIS